MVAFTAIIGLLIFIVVSVLLQTHQNQQQLEWVVETYQHKIELIGQLKEHVRLRQIGLRDMMITDDIFERDHFKAQFLQDASLAALARNRLQHLNLPDEERQLLEQVSESMSVAYPLQNQLADAIIFNGDSPRLRQLMEETFAAQKTVMLRINQLEKLIKLKNYGDMSGTIKQQHNTTLFVYLAGITTLLLSLLISIHIIHLSRRQEKLVADAMQQLEQNNETLEEKVRERTQELSIAKSNAEAASNEKSLFLSRMSHELRTPLNAVLGFSQLLEEDVHEPYLSSESKKKYIDNINKAGHHLLRLVNDVLDLSRIEQGRFELQLSKVDINQSIQDCITLMQSMATDRGVQITYNNDGAQHCSMLDKNRFQQVLLNLVSNAIKYNSNDGEINIQCAMISENSIRIGVSDTGIGIPADDLDIIFKPFNRLYLASQTTEGNGVGLSLSKHLIEEMGGAISVESSPGKGSTFWLTINRCDDKIESIPQRETPKECLEVLYIQDDADNIKLLEEISYKLPFTIQYHTALTHNLGTELAANNHFNLILIDIEHDKFDFDTLVRLHEISRHNKTPLIGLVSHSENIPTRLHDYLDRIISKPIDVSILRLALTSSMINESAAIHYN